MTIKNEIMKYLSVRRLTIFGRFDRNESIKMKIDFKAFQSINFSKFDHCTFYCLFKMYLFKIAFQFTFNLLFQLLSTFRKEAILTNSHKKGWNEKVVYITG